MNVAKRHSLVDQFGNRVSTRLNLGLVAIHPDIAERLRIARQSAIEKRRVVIMKDAASVCMPNGSGHLTLGSGWQTRLSGAISLLLLTAGLLVVSEFGDEQRAHELADIDTELLSDELPPAAYVDPGFARYLQLKKQD